MTTNDSKHGPAAYGALLLFKEGYNCAQAIMAQFAHRYGCSEDLSLKVAAAFGGSASRGDRPCGAVTGSLMVLGLEYGRGLNEGSGSRKLCDQKADEFIRRFTGRYGSMLCRILRKNTSEYDPTMVRINEEERPYRGCAGFVAGAVQILEDMLQKEYED